jgi:hypothetical protein
MENRVLPDVLGTVVCSWAPENTRMPPGGVMTRMSGSRSVSSRPRVACGSSCQPARRPPRIHARPTPHSCSHANCSSEGGPCRILMQVSLDSVWHRDRGASMGTQNTGDEIIHLRSAGLDLGKRLLVGYMRVLMFRFLVRTASWVHPGVDRLRTHPCRTAHDVLSVRGETIDGHRQ